MLDKMGNQVGLDGYVETRIQLAQQRKKYLWAIGLLTAIGIAFIISTTYLAVKVRGGYPSARVEFHVWSHQNSLQGTRDFKEFKVPHNATVYTLMEHAAAKHGSQFRYDFKQYEFGKYITSIGGVRESVAENLYWSLYKLNDSPNPNSPPSKDSIPELGVDDLRVEDGQVYLFWLTKIVYPSTLGTNASALGALSQRCNNGRILF